MDGSSTWTEKATPLSFLDWGMIALFSAVFAFIVYTFLLVSPPPSAAFTNYNAERFQKLEDDKATVILLGDSRMRYATELDQTLAKQIEQKSDKPVQVLRIVNNWAVFRDFSPLVADILQVDPDLVVIQQELFSKSRSTYATKTLARQYWTWKWFGKGDWDPGQPDQEKLQFEMRCSALNINETVEKRKQRAFKWFNFSANGPSQNDLALFLAELERKNIKAVYLTIPITNAARKGFPTPQPATGLPILSPDFAVPDTDFCDLVHMNPNGRNQYSTWLTNTLTHLFTLPTHAQ